MTTEPFTGWALLEIMGFRQRVGRVSEVEMYGTKLVRIDIPVNPARGEEAQGADREEKDEEFVTEFYGGGSIYALRPLSEDVARDLARQRSDSDLQPVKAVTYRPPPSWQGGANEERDQE